MAWSTETTSHMALAELSGQITMYSAMHNSKMDNIMDFQERFHKEVAMLNVCDKNCEKAGQLES